MNLSKIEKTAEIFNVAARGLNLNDDSGGFIITNKDIKLKMLLKPFTLLPVFSGMSDMLYKNIFPDDDFESLFPTLLQKKKDSLCYVTLTDRNNYNIESAGYSFSRAYLISFYVMKNLLMKNKDGKVELNNLIDLWRTELSRYEEGETIDLQDHKKVLIDFNVNEYPKVRDDLIDLKKTKSIKNIFSV